jgi:predicted NUDIX family NTP pyrophosphohydrolase
MSANVAGSANVGQTASQIASPGRKKSISGAYKTLGALKKAGGKIVKVKGVNKRNQRKKRRGCASGDDAHPHEPSLANNDDIMSINSDVMDDDEGDIFASTRMTDENTPLISNTIFRSGVGPVEDGGGGNGGLPSEIEKVTSGYEMMARNAFIISLAFLAGSKYGPESIATASFVSATLCTLWLGSIVTTRMSDSSVKISDQKTANAKSKLKK